MEQNSFPVTSKVIIYLSNRLGEPARGQVYSVYFDTFMEFCGTLQLLRIMESLFDTLDMPQASHENQEFHPLKRARRKGVGSSIERYAQKEKKLQAECATCMVYVLYRQYNTWQGTITWLEDKTSCKFKSVLEMLKLIDDAIHASSPIQYIWETDE